MAFSCDPQNGGHIEEKQIPFARCSERFSADHCANRPAAVIFNCTETFNHSVKNCLNYERSFSREFMEEAWAIMHFAQSRGLRFVMPDPAVLDDIQKFKLFHQQPLGDEEKATSDEKTEIAKIDNFYLYFKAGEVEEAIKILQSIKYFPGLDRVLNPLMDFLANVLVDVSEGHNPQFPEQEDLLQACENVKSFLHYAIQGKEQMYHGGRFSAGLTADFCGFVEVERVFTNEDGSDVTIVDLGCGDGDWLTTLAKEKRRRERAKMINEIISDLCSQFQLLDKSKLTDTLRKKMQAEMDETLKSFGMSLKLDHEPPDPHLIGVDLSAPALRHLRHPASGISAVLADICSPELTQKPPLKKAMAGLVGTTLTTDRVEDPDQLFANIADLLEDDGRFFIATKGIIDPKTDGKGAEKPIHYSSKLDLISDSPIGTAEKLIEALKTHELEVDTISLVPYHVISLDGPQDFSLLVVIGRKRK